MFIDPTFLSVVRTNIALLGVSTGLANLPFLLAHLLFEIPASGTPHWSYKVSIAATALVIMAILRWCARRAYRDALKSGDIRPSHRSGGGVTIAPHCRRAWLVQMHAELHAAPQPGYGSNF